MKPRKIKDNIYWMGSVDWDRRLFDSLVPLPDGTSYNAYLIKGSEKTALLDTVDPTKTEVLINNLAKTGVGKIDYVVAHHAEQDHSGSLPDVLLKFPDALDHHVGFFRAHPCLKPRILQYGPPFPVPRIEILNNLLLFVQSGFHRNSAFGRPFSKGFPFPFHLRSVFKELLRIFQ